jgi:hypothetical protein
MRFFEGPQDENATVYECQCNKEYNHCIANNDIGLIPEVSPTDDLAKLSFDPGEEEEILMEETTTEPQDNSQAMGFDVRKFYFLVKILQKI